MGEPGLARNRIYVKQDKALSYVPDPTENPAWSVLDGHANSVNLINQRYVFKYIWTNHSRICLGEPAGKVNIAL